MSDAVGRGADGGGEHRVHVAPRQDRSAAPPVDGAPITDAATIDVGGSLRALRTDRRLSIRALAGRSGLAVNTLSLIENGKSSPSVGTLQLLAHALQVPISAFFETGASESEVAHCTDGARPRAVFAGGELEDLGAGRPRGAMVPLVVSLAPLADSGAREIVHTGDELVFCLSGRIEYRIDGRAFLLGPGDSLCFAAHLPHAWRNVGPDTARALVVMCPADERDRPTERHFVTPDAPSRLGQIGSEPDGPPEAL